MEQIVDFILQGLYNDEDNKIDLPILKIQLKAALGIELSPDEEFELLNMLTVEDLCKKNFQVGMTNLELTDKGKSIIYKHKSYLKYMEEENRREGLIINKLQEIIFDQFRKTNSRAGHIVAIRIFRHAILPKLTPPEQDKFQVAANDLIDKGFITYENDSIECFRLTDKGYQRIYDEDYEGQNDVDEQLPTVVILTAIDEEYTAVRNHLSEIKPEKREGTIYETGIFSHNGESVANVVIRECGDRNVNASQETERAVSNFKPDCILFVGIGGSVKPQDFSHGDVIFPTKICYYEGGKAEMDELKLRPDCVHPEYSLEELAKHERRNLEWKNLILNKSEKVGKVKAGIGTVASGEKILEHIKSELGKLIKSGYNDTAVIEMEGFGFTRAIIRQGTEKKIKYGVIRGISDIVELTDDEGETVNRRPDDAKQFASQTAAAFAYWLIYRLYDQAPATKVSGTKPAKAEKKSTLEELEEKKIRLSVKPRLNMNGASSRGFEGELQLNLQNKGERASLKAFRVLEGNVILHNEHLPYELEKDQERKIFLRTKDRSNSNVAKYKIEIEYEDALEFKYISVVEGVGAKCKMVETVEI